MNQSAKKIHVTGAKRGKMLATKTQLVWFYFLLVEKVARDFKPITNQSKAKRKQTHTSFDTQLKTALQISITH